MRSKVAQHTIEPFCGTGDVPIVYDSVQALAATKFDAYVTAESESRVVYSFSATVVAAEGETSLPIIWRLSALRQTLCPEAGRF